jgi:hypothetical protein
MPTVAIKQHRSGIERRFQFQPLVDFVMTHILIIPRSAERRNRPSNCRTTIDGHSRIGFSRGVKKLN